MNCLLAGLLLVVASVAEAQPAACSHLTVGQPSDYYEFRGCGLLQSVEQVHLGPGIDKLRSKYYEAAIGDFHFILAQFPNHPQALILLAQACEQFKSPKCQPGEYFERAIAINPKVAGTYMAMGIYLHRVHQYPKAVESFRRAVEIDPESATAHYDLGLAYLETKQYDLANEQAQTAYSLGASLPGLRNRLEQVGRWKPVKQKPAPDAMATPGSQGAEGPVGEAPKK